jgi:hypothetical protein
MNAVNGTNDALFRSAHAALTFAYAIQHYAIVKTSSLLRELRGSVIERPHDALTAHEWHAQGAMIRLYVEKNLPSPEREFMLAYYSWGPQRRDAMVKIVDYVTPLAAAGVVRRHVIRALVRRYMDLGRPGRQSQREIARELSVPRTSLQRWDSRVCEVMDALRRRAESHVEDHFRHCGLIEP